MSPPRNAEIFTFCRSVGSTSVFSSIHKMPIYPLLTFNDFNFSGSSSPANIICCCRPSFRIYIIGSAAVRLFGILKPAVFPLLRFKCSLSIAQTICSNTERRRLLLYRRNISAFSFGNKTINNTTQILINDDLQDARPPVNVQRSFVWFIIDLNARLYTGANNSAVFMFIRRPLRLLGLPVQRPRCRRLR